MRTLVMWVSAVLLVSIGQAQVDPSAVTIPAGGVESSRLIFLAIKGSAGTISKGSPVFVSGFNATLSLTEVEMAEADVLIKSPAIGITGEDITDTQSGEIVIYGRIDGLNTAIYIIDAAAFLSESPGELTVSPPSPTSCLQPMGFVLKVDATQGIIQVAGASRCTDVPDQITKSIIIENPLAGVADLTVEGTVAADTVTGINVTSGADPGHTHTGVFTPTYATLFETDDNCTTTINTGAVGTFVGWVTAGTLSSSGMTVDLADSSGDSVTIPTTGNYAVSFTGSFLGTNNANMILGFTVDNVITPCRVHHTQNSGNARDTTSLSSSVFSLTAGEKLRIAVDSDGANDSLSICHFSYTIQRVD